MQNENKRRLFKSKIVFGLLALMLCTPSLSLGWGAGRTHDGCLYRFQTP